MVHRAAILFGIAALFFLFLGMPDVKAANPFSPPTFDILDVSPPTLGSNGDVSRRVTLPAGDHLPAIETLTVPAGWNIADDDAIPLFLGDPQIVGSLTLFINKGACPGTPTVLASNIREKAANPGEKARWQAVMDSGALVFDFIITENAGPTPPAGSNTIQALMFHLPFTAAAYCTPMDMIILHEGISIPGNDAVFTNPSVEALYPWSASYTPGPLPAPHPDVTPPAVDVGIGPDGDSDDVADIGDNCPNIANAAQIDLDGEGLGDACDPCPLIVDCDGDGWTDLAEAFIGTDQLNACTPAGWPPDPSPAPDGNGTVLIDDVSFVAGAFGSTTTPRAEIASQDGTVAIDDVSAFASAFGSAC